MLTVPYSSGYTLSMNNPYGKDFELLKPAFQVDLDQQPLAPIEFVIKEKAVEIEWNYGGCLKRPFSPLVAKKYFLFSILIKNFRAIFY
ncbi:MAG: hypothetical protein IPK21_15720 [Haliscomenobacter sp.]|nr:hypothetical protein [Haliscomenobacter sp.]